MRSQLWLLAAAGRFASADWAFGQELDSRGGGIAHLLPRETRASTHDGANGWTPKPTDGPAVELARRRQEWAKMKRQTSNTWVNDKTCGWVSGTKSFPFTCAAPYSCATNADQVVACSSSEEENPFFTVCLDYQAYKNGACESVGPQTGCCMTQSIGECITYLWPGATVKSMYRCFTEREVITMLASPDPGTTTTSSRSSSSSSSSTTSHTPSTTSASDTATSQTATNTPPPASSSGGNNTGAIVGGVVGGVAGVALIAGAIAFVMIRSRRNKNSNVGAGTAYSAVAPGDTAYPGSSMPPSNYAPSSMSPAMSQAGYYNQSSMGGTPFQPPETPYLSSTTPPAPGAYPQSYYDGPKPADQLHPGAAIDPRASYAPYSGPSPPPQGPYPGTYQPQPVSELDTTTVAGHHDNPVEMAANPPTQHH